jgi:hypothetical protein
MHMGKEVSLEIHVKTPATFRRPDLHRHKLNTAGFEKVSFIEGGIVGWPYELRC